MQNSITYCFETKSKSSTLKCSSPRLLRTELSSPLQDPLYDHRNYTSQAIIVQFLSDLKFKFMCNICSCRHYFIKEKFLTNSRLDSWIQHDQLVKGGGVVCQLYVEHQPCTLALVKQLTNYCGVLICISWKTAALVLPR